MVVAGIPVIQKHMCRGGPDCPCREECDNVYITLWHTDEAELIRDTAKMIGTTPNDFIRSAVEDALLMANFIPAKARALMDTKGHRQ